MMMMMTTQQIPSGELLLQRHRTEKSTSLELPPCAPLSPSVVVVVVVAVVTRELEPWGLESLPIRCE